MNRKFTRLLTTGMALASTLFSVQVFATVSVINGNYFVGYKDIIYPGGFEPTIDRIYNSKSAYKGPFGWGWGNGYDVYLSVSADGSVVVHEYGGGADNRFNPLAFSESELDAAANRLTSVAQKAGVAGTPAALVAYKHRLKTDAAFRNDEWEKWRAQGKIEARVIPTGTQLRSNRFSYQTIAKVEDGYVRTFDTGKTERFDNNGRLRKIFDKNGNFVELTYGKDGHLSKLLDNFNRKMFFEFDNRGLLTRLEGENGKRAEYRYNDKQDLVYSKDVDGNTYTYKYDQRHNLIEIGYSDKTTQQIAYYGRDKHENVKSVKDRDGTLAMYTYDGSTSGSDHFAASIVVKGKDGKQISTSRYEYFTKRKPDGERWTQRLISELDGDRTETTYKESNGLPLEIKRGSDVTQFEYDDKGRVTRKTSPIETTELQYDSHAGKVSRVSKVSKGDSKKSWSEFEYDKKGNLIFAKNSEGNSVHLVYDSTGRIHTLKDQKKREISFKYNENSKPVEISDPTLGKITVSYTNSGEIKKVESSAGRQIALQVTSAFQELLEIIRPAGVTLY